MREGQYRKKDKSEPLYIINNSLLRVKKEDVNNDWKAFRIAVTGIRNAEKKV